ncbi:MAG: riboflavin synthase [Bdellovibrionales bacterium]|nr:riboflavin synthase [Bdellovibrionales bacterium]
MFSGIIEAKANIIEVQERPGVLQIRVVRPSAFEDIKVGDSISTNGVCLTVEDFSDKWLQFAIGFETLSVTGWSAEFLKGLSVNLERSLRFGDRLHGHMVSGHVEETGKVVETRWEGENLILTISFPDSLAPFIWKKGSVALQGVSLTVNTVDQNTFSVCLVPETIEITNLKNTKVGELVNLEADYFAKALHHFSREAIHAFRK